MNKIKHFLLQAVLLVGVCLNVQAQKTEIKGTVLDDDGEPAMSVVIRDTDENGEIYGTTDYEGHFHIKADPATCLHFSGLTYMPKTVKLKGKTTINVTLSFQSQKLGEIVVVAKRITDKMTPEQIDIEIVGNQYVIHPKIKIPGEMFKPNTRIVVQPILENRTQGIRQLFRPAVVTGKQYAVMLERMMEFDTEKDPLSPYYQKSTRTGDYEVVAYTDSIAGVRPNDECRCNIYMYLVNYRRVVYKDTATIAQGTVNPMRFFECKIAAANLTDNRYIPRREKLLRGEKENVNLTFVQNGIRIDDSDPNNAIELTKIQQRLLEIQNRYDTEFLSFDITGVSSPEGRYEDNLKLAQRRTVTAKNEILGCLRTATVNALRDSTTTKARVENWESIVGFMRRDSLPTDKLETIIRSYPGDMDRQFREIRNLPDYLSVIRNYLPRLRRVECSFTYSILRPLRDDEIQNIYEEDYTKLTRYDFWRLYAIEKSDSLREKICRRALEVYPEFMAAANELAALLIGKGKPDVKLLEPFVDDKAPREVLNNQVAALLAHREFQRADSVAGLMPDSPETEDIRIIAHAFNGEYKEAYSRFASEGGINEVALLLAMKRNEEAWQKSQALPDDDARTYYLRAICANRMNMYAEAVAFFKQAMTRDSELMNVARIDGDVTDLVEYWDGHEKENKQAGKQIWQTKDTITVSQYIKASDFLIPHRQGAEKFASRKGVEHLFFSTGSGVGYLLNMGSGQSVGGAVASLYAGNWITPVIGIRGGFDYGMWRLPGGAKTNLLGASADYLINLSAFAARYNPHRLFELVGALGAGYRAVLMEEGTTIHTYGLRAGLQAKFNVSSAFNLFIEPQAMLYPDRVDNACSWRRFDLTTAVMVGITYKPSGFAESVLLRNGFASLAVGTANTRGVLFNTETALGKWLDEVSGIRISAGSSTTFLKKVEEGSIYDAIPSNKDFNISLNADYLCNLSNLFAQERHDRLFSMLFVAGVGSYFPGSDATEKIVINGRFGFQGNVRLSRHYSAWLEPRVDLYKDNTERKDMQKPVRAAIGLMLGISYGF